MKTPDYWNVLCPGFFCFFLTVAVPRLKNGIFITFTFDTQTTAQRRKGIKKNSHIQEREDLLYFLQIKYSGCQRKVPGNHLNASQTKRFSNVHNEVFRRIKKDIEAKNTPTLKVPYCARLTYINTRL